jgi:tight adherence protein B
MIAPIASLERRPEFSGVLREDYAYARGDGQGTGDAVNGSFDRLMRQSGIQTAPPVWLSLCLLSGVALGGLAWLVTERVSVSSFMAIAGLLLPIVTAMILRSRRQRAIMNQLPGMAEELARSARAGRNLEQSFRLVAADTASPLGDELRWSARRMDMGLDIASAVRDLSDRTGVSTLTVFSSAVSVHQETGGDLISVLERLATAVRDRLHFVSRQRAATIAARLGTAMMVVIPVLVVSFYVFRDANYLNTLLNSFWGRLSLWMGIVLQIAGGLLVLRILRRSARF